VANLSEVWTKFKGTAIAGLSALVVGAIGSACLAVYQVAQDVALKTWVVEHVDQRFEAEAYRQQVRDDLRDLMALKEKASDPDVIAGLERQIEELEARLEG
jgi:hypothetical protein